jgi:hypothetical protein
LRGFADAYFCANLKENIMLTFENGMDARCRDASTPTVARFHIGAGTYHFCVIGTQYGYLRTSSGDVRTWKTASGARHAIRRYVPL